MYIYSILFLNYSLLIVPCQANGFDCGVYVCHYAYSLMCIRHTNFCFETLSGSEDPCCISPRGLTEVITNNAAFKFHQSDITLLRKDMKNLIRKLAVLYKNCDGKTGFNLEEEHHIFST